jgi:uncharacterized coiled-coil protein SlyX
MNAEHPFSPALWKQTPAAVQDYIRALEARVTALESAVQRLEATVQQLTEQLRQVSRTSSRPPGNDRAASLMGVGLVASPVTRDTPARWSRSSRGVW